MSEKRAFVTLDGLRGIAALVIVTRHAPAFFASISIYVSRAHGSPLPVGPFFESYLAVDFFFALSGFVLSYAYGERLQAGMGPGRFMTIRLIRLYPLYLLTVVLSFGDVFLKLAHGEIETGRLLPYITELACGLFFLPSPTSPLLFPLNPPAWSLFFELLANAFYGLMAPRLKMLWLLLIVGFAGSVLVIAVCIGWLGFGSAGIGAMNDGFEWQALGAGVVRVMFSFFAGILVFRVWNVWHPRINVPPLLVAAVLTAILVANPPDRYQTAFDLIATLLMFPCLIFFGASSVPTGLLARLFTWSGTASYAVYVLQAPIYDYVQRAVTHLSGGTPGELPWTWGVLFIVIIFSVAITADKYIDGPARNVLSSLFLKRRAPRMIEPRFSYRPTHLR